VAELEKILEGCICHMFFYFYVGAAAPTNDYMHPPMDHTIQMEAQTLQLALFKNLFEITNSPNLIQRDNDTFNIFKVIFVKVSPCRFSHPSI
jgi:hypothetical protein